MIDFKKHTALKISIISVVAVLLMLLTFWLWLLMTIPKFVKEEYKGYAGDTHLQSSLYYCMFGPKKVYAIKALYAKANSGAGGEVGYVNLYTGNDLLRDEYGGATHIDLDASGKPINDGGYFKKCIPLKWETKEAIP